MTKRTRTVIVFLVLAQGLAGCGGPSSAPLAPTPITQTIQLLVFSNSQVAPFSISDVRDAQDEIVNFNSAGELIWTADGTRFKGYTAAPASGAITADKVCPFCSFLVRFGTQDGERRAYLTWPDSELHGTSDHPAPTILDLTVVGGKLVITETKVPVPRLVPAIPQ